MALRESSHKFESDHKDSSKCKKVLQQHPIDCFGTSLPIQRVSVKVLNTKSRLIVSRQIFRVPLVYEVPYLSTWCVHCQGCQQNATKGFPRGNYNGLVYGSTSSVIYFGMTITRAENFCLPQRSTDPTAFLSCVFALLYLGCFSFLLTTLCRPLVVF